MLSFQSKLNVKFFVKSFIVVLSLFILNEITTIYVKKLFLYF